MVLGRPKKGPQFREPPKKMSRIIVIVAIFIVIIIIIIIIIIILLLLLLLRPLLTSREDVQDSSDLEEARALELLAKAALDKRGHQKAAQRRFRVWGAGFRGLGV